jgi:predicted hydrocarbon binding protein
MVDESVTVKGSPVRSLQKFVEAALTPAQREEMFRNLPIDYARRFQTPILATETVPLHMLNRFTEEAAKAKGEPLDEFGRRAGRDAAGDAVKGIYRFFALVLTPPALLSKASHMWSAIYNRGQLTVEEQTDRTARIKLTDFPSELAMCARVTGWIERMAELTGVSGITIEQTKCFAKGDGFCEWTLKWK